MKNPSRTWPLKLMTMIVLTACFVVIGTSIVVTQNFKRVLTLWGEDLQLTVYLAQDLSEAGRTDIEKRLKESQYVADVNLVNQEKALSDFRAQLASYAPDLSQDEELLKLIPSSYQVKIKSEIPSQQQSEILASLAAEFKGYEGVDEVSYGQDWVEKYAALVNAIESTFQLLGIVIILAASFVVSNAVRASIQNRKEEIVVLEMIGATASMIRWPYIKEGALLGFVSSAMGLLFSFALFYLIRNVISEKLSFLQLGGQLQFIPPVGSMAFIMAGTLVGALASYLCIRKINDGYSGLQG